MVEGEKSVKLRITVILLSCVFAILIGQKDRELLPPDDLREVEVAREMYEGGDYVVPHLAGLPFVEKPPGFQAVVATAYRIVGHPSAAAARFISAAFAMLSLTAVFLLGWYVLGIEGGALAAALLGLSQRFLRTAHLVILDNALVSAVSFSMLFVWIALDTDEPRRKRLAYAAAGAFMGLAFLVKGFVGPAIFGSGFLVYLILSRRLGELRYVFHPLPVLSFIIPAMIWVVPFLLHAPADLLREFFIANHLGRFVSGYISPHRNVLFYLEHLLPEFAPGAFVLPPAIWMAWRTRSDRDDQAGIFFLSLFIGPLILLTASKAKDFIYLLPAHPALAMLVAWCITRARPQADCFLKLYFRGMSGLIILAAAGMAAATGILGGMSLSLAAAVMVLVLAGSGCVLSLRRESNQWAIVWMAVLLAMGWGLWFTGPIARADVAKRGYYTPMMEALRLAGGRDIVLYLPSDGLRGSAGFYRNRTAEEIKSPDVLVARLAGNAGRAVVLLWSDGSDSLPADLAKAARNAGVHLVVEHSVDFGKGEDPLLIVHAVPDHDGKSGPP
jgi:4-amino-4-deoxy-L-arabinose transferase-like glycosyltransferase